MTKTRTNKLISNILLNKVVKLIGDETTNKHNVKNKPIYNIIFIVHVFLCIYREIDIINNMKYL